MGYRILNESRLDDATVDGLVAFAWARVPGGITGSTAIKLHDASGASGRAMPGAMRKWAGRARHALTTGVPPADWSTLGLPRVCWHSTDVKRRAANLYSELRRQHGVHGGGDDQLAAQAIRELFEWTAQQQRAGATHIGRWPIWTPNTIEEAVVHTLAHELMHVLAADRQRGKQSELLCEEFALTVLTDWKENHGA